MSFSIAINRLVVDRNSSDDDVKLLASVSVEYLFPARVVFSSSETY